MSRLQQQSSKAFRKSNLSIFNDDNDEDSGVDVIANKNASFISSQATISEDQREVITKTAQFAFNNPDKVSQLISAATNDTSKNKSHALAFLVDKDSSGHAFYKKELQRLHAEREVRSVCAGLADIPPSNSLSSNLAVSSSVPKIETSSDTNRRRNRWGPAVPTATSDAKQATSSYEYQRPTSSSSSSIGKKRSYDDEASAIAAMARSFDDVEDNVNSSLHTDSRIQRLIEEQKEIQLLEARIRDAAAASFKSSASGNAERIISEAQSLGLDGEALSALALPLTAPEGQKEAELYLERLKQYKELAALDEANMKDTIEDAEMNNGVIEGGTWEHRKRAKEMLSTAAKNLELTFAASSSGGASSRHLSDYLPPEVLQSFLSRATAINKVGSSNDPSVPKLQLSSKESEKKVGEDNIGYKLLQKSGWSEGSGLGASSTGIEQPLSSSSGGEGVSTSSAGLGVKPTFEVEAGDDSYDQYRKRMMLAYRFRPNPLNNPRRNYY